MPRKKPKTKEARKRKEAKVMREHQAGKLRSSSGTKVTKRSQAVAIALSESGQAKKKRKKKK